MRDERLVEIDGRELVLRNLDKVLFPDDGYTKADLINYYLSVSTVLLPHLRDRPVVFTRWPDGITAHGFYQKDLPQGTPEWIPSFPWHSRDSGRTLNLCLCRDRPTLTWLAAQACVEFHAWMSRIHGLDRPDYAAFDLDPEPPADWSDVCETAVLLKDLLGELGVTPLVKTSGGSGLHLFVPLAPIHGYRSVREFVRTVAVAAQQRRPGLITLERLKRNRTAKVYVDYLQIYKGKTLTAPYSVRPHKGAPVSTPIEWDELARAQPDGFTIATVPERVALADPFAAVLSHSWRLPGVASNSGGETGNSNTRLLGKEVRP